MTRPIRQKPWVYIAGPLTKPNPVVNARKAMEMWAKLAEHGTMFPICPHWSLQQEFVSEHGWDWWLEYDEELILNCDAVFRMDGDSDGADREVVFAEGLNIPVFTPAGLFTFLDWCREWRP